MTLSACLRGMTKNSSFLRFRAVFMSYRPLFRGHVEIYKEYDSLYILERNDKKNSSFSWAIAHCFGVLDWFTRSMTLSTCLRGMTKNSSFLRFRVVFVSYCPQFWGDGLIYKVYDSLYILERNDKKTWHFCVYGHFCELLPTVLGYRGDLQGPCHSVHVWEEWPKTRRFCILGPFS
jgi:hypothetical protein